MLISKQNQDSGHLWVADNNTATSKSGDEEKTPKYTDCVSSAVASTIIIADGDRKSV